MKLETLRKEYLQPGLVETDVDPDPLRQFERWFLQAQELGTIEANAMALATVSPDGLPAVRTVLLKQFDERGFVWYTNYDSPKGQALAANPVAAVLFYWRNLERQVRLTGPVVRTSREESLAYFQTRPRGSQIAANVSHQSAVVAGRAVLEEEFATLEARYGDGPIPLPEYWGGYRLTPRSYEFWQGRPNRLHDRLRYLPDGRGGWKIERLSP